MQRKGRSRAEPEWQASMTACSRTPCGSGLHLHHQNSTGISVSGVQCLIQRHAGGTDLIGHRQPGRWRPGNQRPGLDGVRKSISTAAGALFAGAAHSSAAISLQAQCMWREGPEKGPRDAQALVQLVVGDLRARNERMHSKQSSFKHREYCTGLTIIPHTNLMSPPGRREPQGGMVCAVLLRRV